MNNSFNSMFQGNLFADEDVVKWREEKQRLMDARHKIALRIQALDQMISGAELYSKTESGSVNEVKRERAHLLDGDEEPTDGNSPPLTMHDVILSIVQQNPKGLEPRQIAAAIREDESLSPKIRESHPNYLYTAIARLVTKGRLRKDGAVYKAVKNQTAG